MSLNRINYLSRNIFKSEKSIEQWKYKGAIDCFSKMLKEEGISALYKGAWANVIRTMVSDAQILSFLSSTLFHEFIF